MGVGGCRAAACSAARQLRFYRRQKRGLVVEYDDQAFALFEQTCQEFRLGYTFEFAQYGEQTLQLIAGRICR